MHKTRPGGHYDREITTTSRQGSHSVVACLSTMEPSGSPRPMAAGTPLRLAVRLLRRSPN
jgi:hypothetical protein